MSLGQRVVYAPIRRQGEQRAGGGGWAEEVEQEASYVDDQSDCEELGGARRTQAKALEAARSDASSQTNSIARNENENEQEEEEDEQVEEVYLCSCCGETRQLEPAMKYAGVFASLLALVNSLLLLFGLASLALGLWFRLDPKVYELHRNLETQNFTLAGWLMLAGGLVASLLALTIGCRSSARRSMCALIAYATLAATLAICSLVALVLLTVYGLGEPLERFLTKEMLDQIRRRSLVTGELEDAAGAELAQGAFGLLSGGGAAASNQAAAAQFVDFVQVKLACCGARDFRDYQKLGAVVPATCYAIAANFIQAPGCGRAMRELFDLRAGLAAGCTAAAALSQLLAALLASLMACALYNKRASPRPLSSRPRSPYELISGGAGGAPVQLGRPICSYPAAGSQDAALARSAAAIEV